MAKDVYIGSKQHFIDTFYDGDRKAYLRARRADYCAVQLTWTDWLDGLCKSGEITQEQWQKATF